MPSLRAVALLLIMLASLMQAQERAALLDSIVTAERTFRADAVRLGIRRAFLAHAGEGAVLFRPGPVVAREHLEAQEDQPGMLEWEPAFGDVSAAGDMGFTTGPWSARAGASDTVAASGYYATVWVRQKEGGLRFVIDHGVRGAELMPVPEPMTVTSPGVDGIAVPYKSFSAADVQVMQKGTLARLQQSERELAKKATGSDGVEQFMRLVHDDARVQRRLTAPMSGAAAIRSGVATYGLPTTVEPIGGAVAWSGELAYTYGSYAIERAEGSERGHYLRVWRRMSGEWRITFDLLAPAPPAPSE
jgi:ketosteroid isomerase-like protein